MSAERGASSLIVATAVQRDVPTRLPRSYACSVQLIRKLSSDARTTLVTWIDTVRRPTSANGLEARAYSPRNKAPRSVARSEEHTSELQSLMRISYAVFCLQKKQQLHCLTI